MALPMDTIDTEDVTELRFGEDFKNPKCLSNAEVAVILEKLKTDYENQERELTPVFQKTYGYVQRFSGIRDPIANHAAVTELREALANLSFERETPDGQTAVYRLHEYEIAALSNLNPEEVEEATTLIPSLQTHFREDEIDEILRIVSRTTARMFG